MLIRNEYWDEGPLDLEPQDSTARSDLQDLTVDIMVAIVGREIVVPTYGFGLPTPMHAAVEG